MLDNALSNRQHEKMVTHAAPETVIASTTSGKVRDRKRDGTYYFGAIPYLRARRFEKLRPVEPFSDVFDAHP